MKRLQGEEWNEMKPYLKAENYEKSRAGHIKGIYRHVISGNLYFHWLSDEEQSAFENAFSKTSRSRISVASLNFADLSVGDLVRVTACDRFDFFGVVLKLYPVDSHRKDRAFIQILEGTTRTAAWCLKTSRWKRYCCDELHGYFAEQESGDAVVKVASPSQRTYITRTSKVVDCYDGDGGTLTGNFLGQNHKESCTTLTTYFLPRDDMKKLPGFVFVTENNLSLAKNDEYGCCIMIDPRFSGDVTPLTKKAVYRSRIARLESKL